MAQRQIGRSGRAPQCETGLAVRGGRLELAQQSRRQRNLVAGNLALALPQSLGLLCLRNRTRMLREDPSVWGRIGEHRVSSTEVLALQLHAHEEATLLEPLQ